mgnify:CR=1 FL=1
MRKNIVDLKKVITSDIKKGIENNRKSGIEIGEFFFENKNTKEPFKTKHNSVLDVI